MSDSDVYRKADTPQKQKPQAQATEGRAEADTSTDIEVPFTDYEGEHKHPFMVDHFKLGDTWAESLGGFTKEINLIEGYFKDKIQSGDMDNSVEAVKERMKGIYKLCGIDKTERTTMQIEKLAAYIEFLKKTDHIKLNHNRYGRTDV
jgi:hypothetical protein